MTRHLLKLVWNRKRTTLLVMVEIAVAFLVLFAVVAFGTYVLDNWRRPVGFAWERVWDVEVASNTAPGRISENISRSTPGPGAAAPQGPDGAPAVPATPSAAPPASPGNELAADPRYDTLRQLMGAIREFPEIEASTVAAVAPFAFGGMVSVNTRDGKRLEYGANDVTDTYHDVLGLRLTRGRWFSAEDRG